MHLTTPLLYLSLYIPLVLSSGCTVPPCGRVNNASPYSLKWADPLGRGRNRCHVYNWHGGSGGETWGEKRDVKCKQNSLSAGDDKGGYFNDKIDVDGFCYADRSYKIQWSDGRKYILGAGVWTKIKSSQTALCKDINGDGTPECYIA